MIAFENEKRMRLFEPANMTSHGILYSIKDGAGYRVSIGNGVATQVIKEVLVIIYAKV